jgi:hypothetical protein
VPWCEEKVMALMGAVCVCSVWVSVVGRGVVIVYDVMLKTSENNRCRVQSRRYVDAFLHIEFPLVSESTKTETHID